MAKKVKLQAEEADALEKVLEQWDRETAVSYRAIGNKFRGSQEILNNLPLDKYISAIYVGYEIEESPEESLITSIRSAHNRISWEKEDTYGHGYHCGRFNGLLEAGRILGIKLPTEFDSSPGTMAEPEEER